MVYMNATLLSQKHGHIYIKKDIKWEQITDSEGRKSNNGCRIIYSSQNTWLRFLVITSRAKLQDRIHAAVLHKDEC